MCGCSYKKKLQEGSSEEDTIRFLHEAAIMDHPQYIRARMHYKMQFSAHIAIIIHREKTQKRSSVGYIYNMVYTAQGLIQLLPSMSI